MPLLFDDSPSYDAHVVSIIKYMLGHLGNNHPKPDSPVYIKNAVYIDELYKGTFLRHQFKYTRENQYDFEGVEEKVKSCKGSWQTTRDLIIGAINHFEMAKGKDYMPFNKKFLEGITFGTFFEGNSFNMFNGELDSNFMKFINEPKKSMTYTSNLAINKIKNNLPNIIVEPAERFSKKWFKVKSTELYFWYEMEDWARWLKQLKKTFPNVYAEFLSSCKDGSPIKDYIDYLLFVLKKKEGDNPIMNSYYFRLSRYSHTQIDGQVLNWLRAGIDSNKFNIFKTLPKSIDNYYTDESFEIKKPREEKKVVDADELPIF